MKHQFNFQAFKKSLKKSQALANFAFMSFTLTAGAADAMDDLQSDKPPAHVPAPLQSQDDECPELIDENQFESACRFALQGKNTVTVQIPGLGEEYEVEPRTSIALLGLKFQRIGSTVKSLQV